MRWMTLGCQACRDCCHWVMDESRCDLLDGHYEARFGICMYPAFERPFWDAQTTVGGRRTDSEAGAACKTFETRLRPEGGAGAG
jgi:hypothetical protein